MTEKVLLLTAESDRGETLCSQLHSFGIDKLVWCPWPDRFYEAGTKIPKSGWFDPFNMIVISDTYLGNGRMTAELVRKIRREFRGPMIVFPDYATNEGPFACQVAGCNFLAESADRIFELIGNISAELERDHQKAA